MLSNKTAMQKKCNEVIKTASILRISSGYAFYLFICRAMLLNMLLQKKNPRMKEKKLE